MIEERFLGYLQLLDVEDPPRLENRLRARLKEDPDLRWHASRETGDISLGRYGSLTLRPSCDPFARRFFRWWGDRLCSRQQRRRDALTGLVTRSCWERNLRGSLEDRRCVVVLGDIDHFKRFNDRYGHDMGDRVLEGVGCAARDHFLRADHLVRYGGEEILFVLDPDSAPSDRVNRPTDPCPTPCAVRTAPCTWRSRAAATARSGTPPTWITFEASPSGGSTDTSGSPAFASAWRQKDGIFCWPIEGGCAVIDGPPTRSNDTGFPTVFRSRCVLCWAARRGFCFWTRGGTSGGAPGGTGGVGSAPARTPPWPA